MLRPVHTSENVAKNGDIVAESGDIVAETGNIVAKNGNIVAKNCDIVAETGDNVAETGNIVFLATIFFIIKIVHRAQVKRKQIQTQKKTQKYRHTHKKEESEINPKDESRNQPVHRAVIKHEISSILNISAQSSGLSLNNKKSFRTETFANSSADTLDR